MISETPMEASRQDAGEQSSGSGTSVLGAALLTVTSRRRAARLPAITVPEQTKRLNRLAGSFAKQAQRSTWTSSGLAHRSRVIPGCP
jgi:hypothetical protein